MLKSTETHGFHARLIRAERFALRLAVAGALASCAVVAALVAGPYAAALILALR